MNPTGNGFPLWVEDRNAVRLDLPVPPYGDGVNAPTLIFDPVITGNALSEASGFGPEAFFYLAESTIDLPNGGRALLVLAIGAAYGAEDPLPGDQFLFARVRVRFDATVAGTYTVTHPWGVETLEVTAGDVGSRFSHTYDFGGFAPLCPTQPSCLAAGVSESPGFERILLSPKEWVFMTADTKVVNVPGEEAYIIGDGVTSTTVSRADGGVVTFTIVGPDNAFGPGVNTVTSNLFTVSGHLFGQPIPTVGPVNPAQNDTVTITRARWKRRILEIRATSDNPNAVLTAEGFGELQNRKLIIAVTDPPPTVTVTSNFGGSDTQPVDIR